MDECRLQGGNSCVSNCNSLIGSETTACGWLGCNALGFDLTRFDNVNVLQIIALISSLVFIGIIVIGVVYVIKGSLKIISSEGDSSKIEEGTKIFKGVMIGLVMIFQGILGVLLMIALFDASSVTQVSTDLPTLN